ncbi:MAG TPA: mechanosensitive ion channel domain-containing protein [Caulobacteraceae bacterium]
MREFDTFVLLRLGGTAITLGGLITAVVILIAAFVVAGLVQAFLRRLRGRYEHNASAIYIVEKLAGYGLVIIGAVIALSSLGLNMSPLAVFAGAIGIGVGLGLQGVVKEFVSGLVLVFDGVINVGDYIEINGGARGMVQEIGPRATRIRNNDNVDVLVPNSHLIESPVTNWTLKGDTRRIHVPFGVAYGSDKDKVREAVLAAAREVPFTLPDTPKRKSQVWLVGFGDSSLNFELVVWPTLDAAKRPASMHAAYTWAIDEALRGAGIEIPFPQRDVRLRGFFGREGAAALKALKLTHEEPSEAAAPRAASPNDAADDLIRSVQEEEEQAAAEQEPPEQP